MSNQIKDFAAWATKVAEVLAEVKYKAHETDLDVLSGMFRCGMTFIEAAQTLSATGTRYLTEAQSNYYCIALAAQQLEQNRCKFIFALGATDSNEPTLVKGPLTSYRECKTISELIVRQLSEFNDKDLDRV